MSTDELLKAHQAIIDAWYARWLAQERKRIEAWAKRKGFTQQLKRND